MLNRPSHGLRVLVFYLVELLILTGAFFAGYWLRMKSGAFWGPQALEPLRSYLWLLPAALISWSSILWLLNTYEGFRSRSLMMHGANAFVVNALGSLVLFALVTLLKRYDVNRSLIGVIGVVSFVSLFAGRVVASGFLGHYTRQGYDRHYVIIGGTHPEAVALARHLDGLPGSVFQVRGFVSEEKGTDGGAVSPWKLLGAFSDIPELATKDPVDEVYLLPRVGHLEDYRPLIERCEAIGIVVHLRLFPFENVISRISLEETAGGEFLTFSSAPRGGLAIGMKRLLDVVGALVLLLLMSPFLLVFILLIRLTSKGPAFFRQERSGMNGRPFTMYKFRTMVEGAEKDRAALESRNEMDGPVFKIKEDPRVTGLGKFFRKTSIDELPQLWNVLQGDMSLVGPRPLPVYEVEKFEPWQRRRMTMRPGLTCLWQIGGRNRVTDFGEWMKLDLEYVDRWSLSLDLAILLKTIPAVLGGKGAY